jgi:protein-disulfide isomerase
VTPRFLALLSILVAACVGAVALAVLNLPAGAPGDLTAFDRRVRAYLMTHPEVIMEAVSLLERRNQARRAHEQRDLIRRYRDRLMDSGPLPVAGNASGDVTVVEFFDYRCPYCRQAVPEVKRLLAADPGVRLVRKEFPVLGPDSVRAARAAIAANYQGKYLAFHDALMTHAGPLDEAAVMAAARAVGLDTARLAKDMVRPEVDAVIRESHALARALGINGTPAFVIGDVLLPGFVEARDLAQAVAGARRAVRAR